MKKARLEAASLFCLRLRGRVAQTTISLISYERPFSVCSRFRYFRTSFRTSVKRAVCASVPVLTRIQFSQPQR